VPGRAIKICFRIEVSEASKLLSWAFGQVVGQSGLIS
jgi:hypothetical protein